MQREVLSKYNILTLGVLLYVFVITVVSSTGNVIVKVARVILVTCFLCFLLGKHPKTKTAASKTYFVWQIGFVLICALSYFWSVSRPNTIATIPTVAYVTFANLIILYAFRQQNIYRALLNTIIVGAILHSLLIYGRHGLLAYMSTRGNSNLENANTLAFITSFGMIFSCMLLQGCRESVKPWYYVTSIACFIFAILTGSKKIFIFIGIFFLLYYIFNSDNIIKNILNIIICVLLILITYVAFTKIDVLYNLVGMRIETMISGLAGGETDSSTSFRLDLIQWGLSWASERPALGYGLDCFKYLLGTTYPNLWTGVEGVYAHNNYVEILVNLGVVGLVAYYWFYLFVLYRDIRYFKNDRLKHTFSLAIIVALAVAECGQVSYFNPFLQLTILITYILSMSDRNAGQTIG